MKKVKISVTILIVLLLVYAGGCFVFAKTLIPNTKIYNSSISLYSEDNVKTILDKQDIVLNLKDSRKEIKIPLSEIEYKIDNMSTLKEDMLKKQNYYKWPITMITSQNIDEVEINLDQKSLKKAIKEYKVISNKGLMASKDAYFHIPEDTKESGAEDKVTVVKEVVGEQLDSNLVEDTITNTLKKGKLDVNLSKAIIKPTVVASVLEKTIDEVDYKLNNDISVVVEGKNYTVKPSKKDKLGWLNIDYKKNEIVIEKKAILQYLKKINSDFIKKGGSTETVYKVNNGTSTLVKTGKAVSGIDEYGVTAKIYNAMKNNITLNDTVKAVSISKPKIVYQGHNSIDNNLVEVSISKQKVYLYQDGKLVLAADTVTGKPNGDTDTPKGKFSVMYKTTNFTLKGADYGYDYRLPVAYWIPFKDGGGVGLHDAPWRANSSFGGNLYLSDGSHGCINMRLADVRKIYNTVVAGTAVWVH